MRSALAAVAQMKRDIDRSNQFHSYMRGWKNGSCHNAKDPVFTEHETRALAAAYLRGYKAGQRAVAEAGTWASKRYRHTPSILR